MTDDHRPVLSALAVAFIGYVLYTTGLYLEAPTQSLAILVLAGSIAPLLLNPKRLPFSWLLQSAGVFAGCVAILWLFVLQNQRIGFSEFDYWPLMLLAFGALFVIVFIGSKFVVSSAPAGTLGVFDSNKIRALHLSDTRDGSFLDKAIENEKLNLDVEITNKKVSIATNLSSLQQLEETVRTHAHHANAIIAAYAGAARLEVTPGAPYDVYKLEELKERIARQAKELEVELDHRRATNEYTVDLQSGKDLGNRSAHELLQLKDQLHGLEREAHAIKTSNLPDEVKAVLIARTEAAIKAVERLFNAKAGPESVREDVDGKDL
jgi:hypothetical protein